MRKLIYLLFGLVFFSAILQAAPVVGFETSRLKSAVGDTVVVQIIMKDFPTTEGGGINLNFNPKVLQATHITIDPIWDFATKLGTINNSTGNITDLVFSNFKGITGNTNIATIEFKAVKQGKSALALTESKQNPFAGSGNRLTVSLEKASVRIGGNGNKHK